MTFRDAYPAFQALAAALLFGVSAPVSKLLLHEIEPAMLAGLLYLGSGAGLLLFRIIRKTAGGSGDTEAKLAPSDIPWLAAATLAGGVAAPIILLFSLRHTPAATASLLLNFECAATTLIAAILFKESISRRAWGAILCITFAGILLSTDFKASGGLSFSTLGVLMACLFWGIDNNFIRNISAKDPLAIVTIKGFGAGLISLGSGFLIGNPLPRFDMILGAMILGCMSYGLSIVLFIYAMRGLGAGRTSALFATAPIFGIILSLILFQETPDGLFIAALPIMIIGAIFLVTEQHKHIHRHEEIIHEHRHAHTDGHHDRHHRRPDDIAITHTHTHNHDPVEHAHQHMPDIHHRHGHQSEWEAS
ncbi:MAG: EamA family transporter [Deltaproteobacteria bacterium]|nr:EamA family transporter [Deltaproteobacteria bacterium]